MMSEPRIKAMVIEWTPELTVNNEELDRQHVEIFRHIAQAADALDRGVLPDLDAAVSELADALIEHLAAEEAVMDETLYPDRAPHKAAHELFMADFVQFREDLRERGLAGGAEDWIRKRIPEWLSFHIKVNDAPLAAFLARRNPGPSPIRPRRSENKRYS
jgi:hemerythrin-like metal-binding protein